jgi:aminopeptidase N
MLRADLGPDLYRKCINTYVERHKFGNVVTDDLNKIIDELSGRSYDKFFDQWVYHAHFPELDVDYTWDEQTKLAKVSVKQTQKLSDDVLLFECPLKIVFKGRFGAIEKTAGITKAEEDFYFALPQAPTLVLLNPDFSLLAKIDFHDQPTAMLHTQLEDKEHVAARLTATEQLKNKKDQATIDKLKKALNADPFYGVRIQAANALQSIHSDESLEALIVSTKQADARVRKAVIAAISGFYNEKAYDTEHTVLAKEKNTDIIISDTQGLGLYHKPEIHDTLIGLLNRPSYRESVANGAIAAMRSQDDPIYVAPIRDFIQKPEPNLQTRSFASALETIGYLARNETNKDEPHEFLLRYINSKKKGIQLGAMRALGLLEDPKAIAVLETFANSSKETEEQPVAEKAIADIRAARKPTDNLKELRDQVLDLQKQSKKLEKDFEDLQKKSAPKRKR